MSQPDFNRNGFRRSFSEGSSEKPFFKVVNTLNFGPCEIRKQVWRSLRLTIKSYSRGSNPKEVHFALFASLKGKRFVIEDFVPLIGEHTKNYCTFSFEDLRKIEKEAGKQALTFVGTLHTHCNDTVQPSLQDRVLWLSLMFEFNRPLYYFIISAISLKLAAYTISYEEFLRLKEAIKFIPFHVEKE